MPSLADERRRLKDEAAKKAREEGKQPSRVAVSEQEESNATCQANSRAAKLEADEIRLRLKELDGMRRNKPKTSVSVVDGAGRGDTCEDGSVVDDVAAPLGVLSTTGVTPGAMAVADAQGARHFVIDNLLCPAWDSSTSTS
jgi:hypothetical protein